MALRCVDAWLYGQSAANGRGDSLPSSLAICSPFAHGRRDGWPIWGSVAALREGAGAPISAAPQRTGLDGAGRNCPLTARPAFQVKFWVQKLRTGHRNGLETAGLGLYYCQADECRAGMRGAWFWLTVAAPEVENSSHVTVSLLPSHDRSPKWRELDHEQR